MKAAAGCYSCLIDQTRKTIGLTSQDDSAARKIEREVRAFLDKNSFEAAPAELGREVYRIISGITGIEDPFKDLKKEYTRKALELYPVMKEWIRTSENPLLTATKLAIAGNIIDFGLIHHFRLEDEVKQVLTTELTVDHFTQFRRAALTADFILMLGDNAGETVFDRLLIEELGSRVIYAVRGAPIINDAVHEDAVAAGLDKVAEIISSGSDAAGTSLSLVSDEFLEIFDSAPMIISKGQGNYECLSGIDRPVFYLLKAKCRVIADYLSVPQGSLILFKE